MKAVKLYARTLLVCVEMLPAVVLVGVKTGYDALTNSKLFSDYISHVDKAVDELDKDIQNSHQ